MTGATRTARVRLRLTREHALLLVFAAIAVVVGIVAYLDNPTKFVALLAAGLAQGAIVTLAALGFLLIQKATGIANFAQGDLITLGAYLASWAVLDLGFDLVPAYVFAIGIMFVRRHGDRAGGVRPAARAPASTWS